MPTDFLCILLTLTLTGVLPFFLILRQFVPRTTEVLIISIGLSPLVLALLQIVTLSLGLSSFLTWTLSLTTTAAIALLFHFSTPRATISFNLRKFRKYVLRVFLGSISGILGWLFFSFKSLNDGRVYIDQVWNLSIVQEFTRSISPQYPMWFDPSFKFIYHYLINIYWASLSHLTGVPAKILIFQCSPLISWTLLGILSALVMRHFSGLRLLFVSILAFLLYPNTWWSPLASFFGHISFGISNFMWGLPVLIGSIWAWKLLFFTRYHRFKNGKPTWAFCAATLLLSISLSFTKGSFGVILVTFELVALFAKAPNLFKRLKTQFIQTAQFLANSAMYPLGVLFVAKSMPGLQTLNTTEIFRDKFIGTFNNSALSGFILIGFFTTLVLVRKTQWNIIEIAFPLLIALNFFLFSYLTHPTFSEFYFVFNILILNSLFLFQSGRFNLDNKIISLGLFSVIFGFLIFPGAYKLNGYNQIYHLIYQSQSETVLDFRSDKMKELENLSQNIPVKARVWTTSGVCNNLYIAAGLNRRVANECPYYLSPFGFDQEGFLKQVLDSKNIKTTNCESIKTKYDSQYILSEKDQSIQIDCTNTHKIFEGKDFVLYEIK